LKKYVATSLISDSITPKEPQNASCKHTKLSIAKSTSRASLWKMWNTPAHVFGI